MKAYRRMLSKVGPALKCTSLLVTIGMWTRCVCETHLPLSWCGGMAPPGGIRASRQRTTCIVARSSKIELAESIVSSSGGSVDFRTAKAVCGTRSNFSQSTR